jgi:hypothetical protein
MTGPIEAVAAHWYLNVATVRKIREGITDAGLEGKP